MKKVHQATQRGKNKWVRRTKWKLDVDDIVGLVIFVLILSFVGIHLLLG